MLNTGEEGVVQREGLKIWGPVLYICSIRQKTYQIIDAVHLKIEQVTGNQAVLEKRQYMGTLEFRPWGAI